MAPPCSALGSEPRGHVWANGRRVRRGNSWRSDRGAAAVEFALVVPLLLALLCGILDYGIWFENAISARQGVREGARQGVVAHFSAPGCTSGSAFEQLACKTDAEVAPINGKAYTKILLPDGTWDMGKQLLVCTYVKSSSITGLTPLPSGGSVKSLTRMTIEVVPSAAPTSEYVQPGSPASIDWDSWCK